MNMIGQAPVGNNQMINPAYNGGNMIGGANTSSQYEYSIEGQIEPANIRSTAANSNGTSNLASGSQISGSVPKNNSMKTQSQSQNNTGAQSMPKRTPHSELTSYQSEKRLKEYKQQQA